jgi:HAD superfamily hydrolase (TIGR01450 family)
MTASPGLLDYSAYVFDLDGTLYLGPYLIPGADTVLAELRRRGKAIRFLSNKPLQTRHDYAEKLRHLGVEARDEEVMNSSAVATEFLLEHHPGKRLYVIGEGPLIGELVEAGFEVVDDGDLCDLVLLSFDRNFHYMKLHHAMIAARRGVPVMATNPDVVCPVENGCIPDCGAVIAALEACADRKIDGVIGKPSDIMLEVILKDLGLPAEQVLLVGDRLETDMTMGQRAGMATALVLSGVTTPEQARAWPAQPTYTLRSVMGILES